MSIIFIIYHFETIPGFKKKYHVFSGFTETLLVSDGYLRPKLAKNDISLIIMACGHYRWLAAFIIMTQKKLCYYVSSTFKIPMFSDFL